MRSHLILTSIILFLSIVYADEGEDILQSTISFQKGIILEGWEDTFYPKSKEKEAVVDKKQLKKTLPSPHKTPIIRKKRGNGVKKEAVKTPLIPKIEIIVEKPHIEAQVEEKPTKKPYLKPEKKKEVKKEHKKEPAQEKPPKIEKKNRKNRLKELKKRQRRDSFKNRKID